MTWRSFRRLIEMRVRLHPAPAGLAFTGSAQALRRAGGEHMAEVVRRRRHAHVWIVGIAAILWNCLAAYGYVIARTDNEAYLSLFSAQERAFFESFPAWTGLFWALGVWGGLVGSLLLLLRRRFAAHAFALSLLGMGVTFGYQSRMDVPVSLASGPIAVMPWVIIAIGVALFVYALDCIRQGALW